MDRTERAIDARETRAAAARVESRIERERGAEERENGREE